MKRVPFGTVALGVSRLGFGCAPVMGRVGRREALAAMSCAFDNGVTHFDIARSYGFGDAERVLGEFVQSRRDKVTITTKFGVLPPELSAWKRAARPLVRRVRAIAAPIKRLVQSHSQTMLSQRRFDVAYARACLKKSLSDLRTDYVDFYLLHEPDAARLEGFDELRTYLDDRLRAGEIRAWGIAQGRGFSELEPEFECGQVVQLESSLSRDDLNLVPRNESLLCLITRPLAGGSELSMSAPVLQALRHELGLTNAQAAFAFALADAGANGAVVAGMFERAHIAANVQAVEYCDANWSVIDPTIARLRTLPLDDLSARG